MKATEKAEAVSTGLSVFMAVGMIVVAVPTHSISILAEGIDTVMDIVASISVMIGLKLSSRHSRTFPLGLYKLENVIACGIGVLILFSSYEIARDAISRIVHKQTTLDQPWLVMIVMAVVVLITAYIAWYKGKVGRQENSPSLKADSKHSWTDALASAAIILGVGLEWAGVPYMDSIAALVVVFFLAWSGVEVIISGVKVLLDASIEKEYLDKAREIAEADPRIREVLEVVGRNSGSYRFMELTLVPADYDLRDSSAIEEELRAAIRAAIADLDQVTFDFVAETGSRLLGAAPADSEGTIGGALGTATAIVFVEVDEQTREERSRNMLTLPFAPDMAGRDVHVAVLLARRGVDVLFMGKDALEEAAAAVLEENGVRVVPHADIMTADDLPALLAKLIAADSAVAPG